MGDDGEGVIDHVMALDAGIVPTDDDIEGGDDDDGAHIAVAEAGEGIVGCVGPVSGAIASGAVDPPGVAVASFMVALVAAAADGALVGKHLGGLALGAWDGEGDGGLGG